LGLEPFDFAFLAVGLFGFDILDFDFFDFDPLGAGLRARAFRAACAALAFFLACLAAFLVIFANFRARFSTDLATRNACFTASACAAAFFAVALNRCAAAASVAGDAAEGEVATIRSRL
jgi:hypothetical protein